MLNDVFYNPTKIIFGKGAENEVGQEIAQYAKKVLLHYGSHSAKKTGLIDRVAKSLNDAGVETFELGGVQANPRYSLTQEGAKICRENGIGFILAVGGGSVIDSAKCIAFSAVNDGDIWQRFFINGEEHEQVLPLGYHTDYPGCWKRIFGRMRDYPRSNHGKDGFPKQSAASGILRTESGADFYRAGVPYRCRNRRRNGAHF